MARSLFYTKTYIIIYKYYIHTIIAKNWIVTSYSYLLFVCLKLFFHTNFPVNAQGIGFKVYLKTFKEIDLSNTHGSKIVSEITLKLVCDISCTGWYRCGTNMDRDTLSLFYVTIF